jgi:D-lactate dehydrogenase
MAVVTTTRPATQQVTSLSRWELKEALEHVIARERVLTRPIDLIAFASDASFYRLIPRAIVLANGVAEIRSLFLFSHATNIPLTFRTAGTSLSGQAVTDGILVEVARHWRGLEVLNSGAQVRVQPGVIGAHVNAALSRYGRKMGPDPASISTCMMGGILSNNSSGMCCGVVQNAYHTLASLRFILPSGTEIDTADPAAEEKFATEEPELARGLLELKRRIESNASLRDRIRAKYRMKNTTGYSLNAFIDFERPLEIFEHVMIGSEGTLAFIAEAVLNTVPDLPVKYTGLLLFPDLYKAAASIVPLRDAGAAALEIMDRASLRSVEDQAGVPASLKKLPEPAAGLLVEFQGASADERSALEARARAAADGLELIEPAVFTHDTAEQALLWKIRAGMFPSVGAVRQRGTTVIIEDVAFPIERLADGAIELNRLFAKHGYHNGIIFGHAKDGNLHFVITQSFNDQAAIDQYARFVEDVVHLVVDKYDGALKGEHGTGRNMAPFVEAEWGREAYEIMRDLKELVDPRNLLNPGVIINPDRNAHLANLKQMPVVEDEVDKCIECGYCEPKCPSRDLTLTARQRIVVRREMARLSSSDRRRNGSLEALERDFPYMGLDTCAVDGLCATACPVGIDTGQLVKRFRGMRHSAFAHRIAESLASNFSVVEYGVRAALILGHLVEDTLGTSAVRGLTALLRKVFGKTVPLWTNDVPYASDSRLPATSAVGADAVYFPSCISRTLGHLPGQQPQISLQQAFLTVAERAGARLYIPDDVTGTCCGVPFSSKGYDRAHAIAVNHAIARMWEWSREGALPVVVDTTPCTYGLLTSRPYLDAQNQASFDRMKIVDGIDFVIDFLLPKLTIRSKAQNVVLHPVCSASKLGLSGKLDRVARACSDRVTVPTHAGCCAFAGDRGFLFPQLTESATAREAEEVSATPNDGCFSSSRTCEIGMTRATGEEYRSFIYLVEMATRE